MSFASGWKISVGALLRTEDYRYLAVRPTYKPFWDIPGGIVEIGEEPLEGLRRELREELGLDSVHIHDLVCLDFIPSDWEGAPVVMLIFSGLISEEQAFHPDGVEISETAFMERRCLLDAVSPNMQKRLQRVFNSRRIYGASIF